MTLPHFWRNVEGYCTFPDYYKWVAEQVPDGSQLVEVGCWKGQSAAILGVELANLGKTKCHIDLVDTFTEANASMADVQRNLEPLARHISITCVAGWSHDVARLFADGACGFVFIDADHTYEAVKRDIAAWRPKVKAGGILGGHDFKNYPQMNFGVIEAVTEAFERFEVWRGINDGGNAPMLGAYWPCWSVRI